MSCDNGLDEVGFLLHRGKIGEKGRKKKTGRVDPGVLGIRKYYLLSQFYPSFALSLPAVNLSSSQMIAISLSLLFLSTLSGIATIVLARIPADIFVCAFLSKLLGLVRKCSSFFCCSLRSDLFLPHGCVSAFQPQQLLVSSSFDDLTGVKTEDLVGVGDG